MSSPRFLGRLNNLLVAASFVAALAGAWPAGSAGFVPAAQARAEGH